MSFPKAERRRTCPTMSSTDVKAEELARALGDVARVPVAVEERGARSLLPGEPAVEPRPVLRAEVHVLGGGLVLGHGGRRSGPLLIRSRIVDEAAHDPAARLQD